MPVYFPSVKKRSGSCLSLGPVLIH